MVVLLCLLIKTLFSYISRNIVDGDGIMININYRSMHIMAPYCTDFKAKKFLIVVG